METAETSDAVQTPSTAGELQRGTKEEEAHEGAQGTERERCDAGRISVASGSGEGVAVPSVQRGGSLAELKSERSGRSPRHRLEFCSRRALPCAVAAAYYAWHDETLSIPSHYRSSTQSALAWFLTSQVLTSSLLGAEKPSLSEGRGGGGGGGLLGMVMAKATSALRLHLVARFFDDLASFLLALLCIDVLRVAHSL